MPIFPENFTMRILSLLSCLVLSAGISAQSPSGLRSIEWLPVQKEVVGEQTVQYLSFKNADYPDLNTLIPNYYELIKIENNNGFEVELQETAYEVFADEEIKNIKYLNRIPAQIEIDSRVMYSRKVPWLQVTFVPLRRNPANGRLERLVRFSFKMTPKPERKELSAGASRRDYALHSVLSTGKWFRIRISSDGIYKLTYDDIAGMGISDPSEVRIYGNGSGMLPVNNSELQPDDLRENAIWFEKGDDGIFNKGDYLLFYGKGPNPLKYVPDRRWFYQEINLYSDFSYYFLTSDIGSGKTVKEVPPPPGVPSGSVTEYDMVLHHELEDKNLIASGSELYGEHFDIVTSQDFEFNIPGLITSEPVRMEITVLARATDTTSFSVSANNGYLGQMKIPGTNLSVYTATYANLKSDTFRFLSSPGQVSINIRYTKNSSSAEGWLDYITINARSSLSEAPGVRPEGQLQFCDSRSLDIPGVAEYRISDARPGTAVWDITDPASARKVTAALNGTTLTFLSRTDSLREFIAFNTADPFPRPAIDGAGTGIVPNQDIHGSGQPDYIIVSHPDFISEARRLAAYRYDHDGLDTLVLSTRQIYNEFSSGSPDVSAIRNMARMFYDRAATDDEIPRYLLLFGDGSYNNKSLDEWNTNYILTYQSPNSLSPTGSFVTDDFFGLLDASEGGSNGLLDVGVGRFPVKSPEEAREVTDKTISYSGPGSMGDWRNTLCFIGDDEDFNIHMTQADDLAKSVEQERPGFIINKIYLDAYQQINTSSGQRYPDVNAAINQRINRGALIINYTGHGGENGLAHERILEINDILSWENKNKYPLFITATCEFSRFDDWEHTSAGEYVLLNPDGGGVALLSTTRLVYSGPNHALNEQFYNYVFDKDENDQYLRLGDIIRLTKNNSGAGINRRSFALLGDPAIILNYPKYRITATTINGIPVSESPDTLKALGKVTVSGMIEDDLGNIFSSYAGTLYPTVFDKASVITTLSNDGAGPFTFSIRNRVLYKGKASIQNGQFSFDFIVPKDISYNYGSGKISFYGMDNLTDANGSYDDVIIGGSSDSISGDTEGPSIKIFMNDANFVSGGTTDENPQLLVYVSDSSGINTVGTGIGHDLTAILDDASANPIVLNDYYEADKDSYKSGKIIYQFGDLGVGAHKLKVKVWDVYNNSAEAQAEFVVASSEDFIIKNLLNYPNPFTTHTSFYFEHNQPGAGLDILIQVFTVSGKLVKTIEDQVTATGYRCGPFEWDGLDDFGSRIGRGVYIYRLKVRTSSGMTVEKFEKLVIL
jgi:hypothetical protein